MNIYFAGSIRGGRDDKELYQRIIEKLSAYGRVLTEHVGHQSLSAMGSAGPADAIYETDKAWLLESNVVVAEVTTPSLGVGYEIATAEHAGKRILCLYRPQPNRSLSAMIAGNARLTVVEYHSIADLESVFARFFAESTSADGVAPVS